MTKEQIIAQIDELIVSAQAASGMAEAGEFSRAEVAQAEAELAQNREILINAITGV
jgi:hypothetical protein